MELWGMHIIEKNVYINASAFLKILNVHEYLQQKETCSDEVELLDGTRIHPENYGVARKFCKDA